MFNYKIINNNYYISSDTIKGVFWPFSWIFVKNKYLWNIKKWLIDEKKYPWYKYSIWIGKKYIFIIWLKWIEKLEKI
jgi:hypothetical protein